jgi:acyl-CoA thioesterase FadM
MITFDYLILRGENGDRLASARTLLVSLDAAGKPVPLPPDVRLLMDRGAASE